MRKLQPKTGRLKFSNLKRKLAANARPRSLASIYRTIFNFPGTSKKKIIFFGKFLLLQTFRNKQMPQFRTLNLTVYCYSKRDIAGQMQFLFLWFFFNRMNISKSQIITVYKVCLKVFVLKCVLFLYTRNVKWAKVTQSCPTLFDPHGLYSTWNSPGQNTGMGNLSLLQGIFPTQGSNPDLLHCRQILYQLSHKGSTGIRSG